MYSSAPIPHSYSNLINELVRICLLRKDSGFTQILMSSSSAFSLDDIRTFVVCAGQLPTPFFGSSLEMSSALLLALNLDH